MSAILSASSRYRASRSRSACSVFMRKRNCDDSNAASKTIMHSSTPATSASVRSAAHQLASNSLSDRATVTTIGYCEASSYPKYLASPSNGDVVL
jgi:hypothetical protein